MQTLTVTRWDEAEQFATLSFGYNKRFSDYLKYSVRPQSYRRWDGSKKRWEVHLSKLPLVINFAKRWFERVDYQALPGWVQLLIAKADRGSDPRATFEDCGFTGEPPAGSWEAPPRQPPSSVADPYRTLHVQPGAPPAVVKAAYRALCLMHHPDKGGSTERLQEINRAFSELEKQRKS